MWKTTVGRKGRKRVGQASTGKNAPTRRRRAATPPGEKSQSTPKANRPRVDPELEALDILTERLPEPYNPEIQMALRTLKQALKVPGRGPPKGLPAKGGALEYFDPLDSIRRVLTDLDMFFLSRQLTYHVAASADLPRVWADPEQVRMAFSTLLEHMARRASRGGRIDIEIKQFLLRSGKGIEINFAGNDRHLKKTDPEQFFADLFSGKVDEISGVALADCRHMVMRQHGQLWADLQRPERPAYHLALPAIEMAAWTPKSAAQTFKYDISISNYPSVRKRFGIKKSASLVTQIEHYVRSLVRYPIDMVMSISEKGTITAIYETHEGAERSVASRISERLGKEEFRIGKRPVELNFKYSLTPLPHLPAVDDTTVEE